MILLDTQVVIWMAFGDNRLGSGARTLIRDAGRRCVSAMVSWEIAMIAGKKRLDFGMPVADWMTLAQHSAEMEEIPVTGAIGIDAGSMRSGLHGDPCDRIMIATARALDCPLMTADAKILAYAAAGHLKAIDARV